MSADFIINTDGGSRGNPGPAGFGAAIRDAKTGDIIVEVADYLPHATNNVAEYKGLIIGLQAARDINPDATIQVRADSKLVVSQMRGEWKIKDASLAKLASEASTIYSPMLVEYQWVPRAQNKDADRLANEAMDIRGTVYRDLRGRSEENLSVDTDKFNSSCADDVLISEPEGGDQYFTGTFTDDEPPRMSEGVTIQLICDNSEPMMLGSSVDALEWLHTLVTDHILSMKERSLGGSACTYTSKVDRKIADNIVEAKDDDPVFWEAPLRPLEENITSTLCQKDLYRILAHIFECNKSTLEQVLVLPNNSVTKVYYREKRTAGSNLGHFRIGPVGANRQTCL
ncbi:MAG: reverse transcriptase-like protein [Actinomycetaceae bacterium]|nr:reverse transcriptase-like protein [Actinomycetaceae bacterium]